MIPKKLGNNDGVKLSSTLGGQRELIRQHRNKINEIIDYLSKTPTRKNHSRGVDEDIISEASKGECTEIPCTHCTYGNPTCKICHTNPPEHEIKSPEFDMDKFKHSAEEAKKTFEHEESWEREIRDENWDTEAGIMTKQVYLRHGRKIGTATTPLKVEMIIDYIKANFVSKEKIKREGKLTISEMQNTKGWQTAYKVGYMDAIKDLLNSLGLGD